MNSIATSTNEGYSTEGPAVQHQVESGLPHTGFDVGLLVLVAVVLTSVGVALRKIASTE